MNNHQKLFANISRYVTLDPEVSKALGKIIRTTRVKKRQFIVQPGFVCNDRNYVLKGALRSYFADHEGKEHTLQIAVEDWFISDFYSYITQTQATTFVEALEDSILLQMAYEDLEPLCEQYHSLSEYFRLTTERAFAYSRKRVQEKLSMTAEARYEAYLARYPQIANRVPQYVLASYLGMSPEFLSKIRSGKTPKS